MISFLPQISFQLNQIIEVTLNGFIMEQRAFLNCSGIVFKWDITYTLTINLLSQLFKFLQQVKYDNLHAMLQVDDISLLTRNLQSYGFDPKFNLALGP